ncbi:MAG: hypothetical protein J6T45_00615 [Fibrobacterales bacterium]|nr:hypothetical protein [Fibrobacterales bacterium]
MKYALILMLVATGIVFGASPEVQLSVNDEEPLWKTDSNCYIVVATQDQNGNRIDGFYLVFKSCSNPDKAILQSIKRDGRNPKDYVREETEDWVEWRKKR